MLKDAFVAYLPYALTPQRSYSYAFIVHPRDHKDVFRKVPLLKYVPKRIVVWFEMYWVPATVAKISGLKNAQGELIDGMVISIPMTAPTMLAHRTRALAQIRRAIILARNKGARIAGLGALTSSLTRGGLDLIDIPGIAITTGHAYSGYTVTETLKSFIDKSDVPIGKLRIAIVGAAGSIGSISAELLARSGAKHLELVDIPSKREKLEHLGERLGKYHSRVRVHTDLSVLHSCHCIITATNAPDAFVTSHLISPGTVIVDDAQPADVSEELLHNPDVIVAAAGAVFTPNIRTHFPMGLYGDEDNYCCLAEVLILAHQGSEKHFVLDRPTLETVDTVSEIGRHLSFHHAIHQNQLGHIPHEHIQHVLGLMKERVTNEA